MIRLWQEPETRQRRADAREAAQLRARRRGFIALDWQIRTQTVIALRACGLFAEAHAIDALPGVVDLKTASAARALVQSVKRAVEVAAEAAIANETSAATSRRSDPGRRSAGSWEWGVMYAITRPGPEPSFRLLAPRAGSKEAAWEVAATAEQVTRQAMGLVPEELLERTSRAFEESAADALTAMCDVEPVAPQVTADASGLRLAEGVTVLARFEDGSGRYCYRGSEFTTGTDGAMWFASTRHEGAVIIRIDTNGKQSRVIRTIVYAIDGTIPKAPRHDEQSTHPPGSATLAPTALSDDEIRAKHARVDALLQEAAEHLRDLQQLNEHSRAATEAALDRRRAELR